MRYAHLANESLRDAVKVLDRKKQANENDAQKVMPI
jgi:hypothetical protein